MKTLVTYFYDEQYSCVLGLGFVPYVIYLLSILYVFIGRSKSDAAQILYVFSGFSKSDAEDGYSDSTSTSKLVYCIAVLYTVYFAFSEGIKA